MHRFTVNGRPYEGKEWYETGEPVSFTVVLPTDVSTHVTSADVDLGTPEYGSCTKKYRFIMPDRDVDVQIHMKSTMMYVPQPAEPMPISRKRPRFCPNCGTPAKEEDRFCSGCGEKLPEL